MGATGGGRRAAGGGGAARGGRAAVGGPLHHHVVAQVVLDGRRTRSRLMLGSLGGGPPCRPPGRSPRRAGSGRQRPRRPGSAARPKIFILSLSRRSPGAGPWTRPHFCGSGSPPGRRRAASLEVEDARGDQVPAVGRGERRPDVSGCSRRPAARSPGSPLAAFLQFVVDLRVAEAQIGRHRRIRHDLVGGEDIRRGQRPGCRSPCW